MSVTIGGVELYMGPKSVGGPDDLDLAIREFIGEADHSLAIAVQEIDSRPIAQAILEAKRRGVQVRVILEGDYLTEEKALADPWNSMGAHEENRIIQGALLKAKVDVISDLNPKIFHQKFIVRDSSKPKAAVLTGSTNFTLTDTGTNADHGHRLGTEPQPHRRAARPARGDRVPAGVQPHARRHLRRPARARRAEAQGVRPARRAHQAAVRAAARPRDGDHEADAEGEGLDRLRDVHVLAVVRHRRHDDPHPPARRPHPRRARPRPGRREVGGDERPRARRRAALRQQAQHRRAQAAPQAHGHRRAHADRRQLQLHRAREHPERREHHRHRRPRGGRRHGRGRPAPSSPPTRSPRSTASSPTCRRRSPSCELPQRV